tara:strand:- start:794 stop:1891 length:1098 start_codon:yes stop_codon:yes gene_type:complete
MKIITIIGARPQFIKAAVVSKLLKNQDKIEEIIVHTGQHYDEKMSGLFFNELEMPVPAYNLGVGSASHGEQTARMIEEIEKILLKEKPGLVLLYGDTNSTLAGSIAAAKMRSKIVHVEAGLRSFNKTMPEEINRIITDRVSDILFCPTVTAVENLKKEGIKEGVYLVGDVMYDSILCFEKECNVMTETLKKIILEKENETKRFLLATIHREENTNSMEKLSSILGAMGQMNEKIILPLHPRTFKYIRNEKLSCKNNIKVIDPVSYKEMLYLVKNASIVLTDSGGIQKEAFIFGVPCITFREETEWIETVESGMNKLVGSSAKSILEVYNEYLVNRKNLVPNPGDYYGNGNSARKIIEILTNQCMN